MNKTLIKDPNWRLSHLYSIVNKDAKRVTFRPNSIQNRVNLSKAKKKRILKARQFGISTNEILKMFDFCLWNKNVVGCILSHEQDSIKKLFEIVIRAYAAMDKRLRPPLDRGGGSKYEYRFPVTGSKIYVDLESRSNTIHWLHISEKAFIEDTKKVKATTEAVPLNGIITEETTPNGLNHFYDDWNDPKSQFENLFFPWYMHEEYQISSDQELIYETEELEFIQKAKKLYNIDITEAQIWFRRAKQYALKELFIQEYPEDDQTCFLASGEYVMDLAMLSSRRIELRDIQPLKIETDGFTKLIHKSYDRQSPYVIGADVAEGVKKDYCVAQVFNGRTYEQCATGFSNNIKPSDFAHEIFNLAKMYHHGNNIWPLVAVERNNHGHTTLQKLKELQYPNLYHTDDGKPGWLTNKVTRPMMIDAWIEGVEDGTITLNDDGTIGECMTLIDNKGKIEAEEGKHDDRVMAGSIGIQMCNKSKALDVYNNIENKLFV